MRPVSNSDARETLNLRLCHGLKHTHWYSRNPNRIRLNQATRVIKGNHMKKIVLLALAGVLTVGCNITPAPASNKILGTLEMKFGSTENPVFSSVNTRTITPKPDSSITAVATSFVTRDQGAVRTLTATYTLTNNTPSTFQNLSLIAYAKVGNSNSSALKGINAFNGTPSSTNVYGVRPAQGTNGIVAVSEFKSDLQLYTPLESNTFTSDAQTAGLMTGTEYALEYGYVARQNSTTHARSIASGGTGIVSLSVQIPVSADVSSGSRFSMTFIVAENDTAHVVQSLEEPVDGIDAAARATNVGVGTEVRVFGNSTSSATPKLTISSVRTAGTSAAPLANMSLVLHYEQLAINAAIPDGLANIAPAQYGAAVSRTFNVPTASGTVSKVTLRAKITHTWRGDIRIRLTSPSGTTVVLFLDTFYLSGDNINVTFDDASSNTLGINCYGKFNCSGVMKPQNPLSSFNNSVVIGNWVVQVDDGFDFDSGTLNELVLEITVK